MFDKLTLGAIIAIALGAAFIWFPPVQAAGQAATFAFGGGLITGGLLGLGVKVGPTGLVAAKAPSVKSDSLPPRY